MERGKVAEGKTVPEMFESRVQLSGDKIALRYKKLGIWHDVTWKQYHQKAKAVCLALIALGLKPGECVSVIGENCPEWVHIDLGIMHAGGTTVGVYATNSWEQCQYVVDHSESRFYFVENEEQLDKALRFRDKVPRLEKIIVWDLKGLKQFRDPLVMSFDKFLAMGEALDKQNPTLFEKRWSQVKPDDLARLIYTSGTTGPPKGAMLSHGNITWMSQAMYEGNPVEDQDEFLSFLPLCHIFEQLFTIFMNIKYGAIVNFIENTDTVIENMREVSPTVAYGVPRIWEKYYSGIMIRMADASWLKRLIFHLSLGVGKKYAFLKTSRQPISLWLRLAYSLAYLATFRKLKERLGFDRVRLAFSGAAPISPDVLRFFQGIGIPLIEGYGMTEGTGVTCANQGDRVKIGTVGQPLPGVEVKIDEDGEICFRGGNVFKGYFKNPQATAEVLKDGWMHSGDVGECDPEGFVKITDRKKDLIITAGGKNIAPQNIENQLKFSSYINDAVVIGDRRKYLVAIIVIDEDNVVKFAQDNKIQYTTYATLTQHPEVTKLIQKEVDAVNKTLANVETVKKFTILPKKLYEEDGEVTPTMKVKRKYINEAFKDLIEAMYKGGD
ncbi:MAG: long-chain fatty acid--CoA ligase [Deltaproteobacteria bacterium]|nr:long-chain fatty acid--CoA ligase [Deltaproteobacteria bacterium]